MTQNETQNETGREGQTRRGETQEASAMTSLPRYAVAYGVLGFGGGKRGTFIRVKVYRWDASGSVGFPDRMGRRVRGRCGNRDGLVVLA